MFLDFYFHNNVFGYPLQALDLADPPSLEAARLGALLPDLGLLFLQLQARPLEGRGVGDFCSVLLLDLVPLWLGP